MITFLSSKGALTGANSVCSSAAVTPGNPNPVNTATRFYSTDFTNPYIQQWNLTVERQISGPSMLMRVTYQGSKGTRLPLPVEAEPSSVLDNLSCR